MGAQQRDADWAALHQPHTDAAALAMIAARHPEFAAEISTHPNAYAQLREWAEGVATGGWAASQASTATVSPGVQVTDEVTGNVTDQATANTFAAQSMSQAPAAGPAQTAHPPQAIAEPTRTAAMPATAPVPLHTWLWVAVLALYVVSHLRSVVVLDSIAVLAAFFGLGMLALLAAAVTALITAPTLARKIGGSLPSFALLLICLIWCAVMGFDWMNWVWNYGYRFDLVDALALALTYAIARPIRGVAWVAIVPLGVLPPVASLLGYWGIYDFIWRLIMLAGGVVLAEYLTRVSVRRASRLVPQVTASPEYAGRTNTLAILSLIFAFFGAILGIIFGHMALSQIRRTGEGGRGMALAGLIISYSALALSIVATLAYVVVIVALWS